MTTKTKAPAKAKQAKSLSTKPVNYEAFIDRKRQIGDARGFEPIWLPDFLIDFQTALCDWSIRKGSGALLADCGMGKTPMQLVWAQNVLRHTNRPVLILTPLAVAEQTAREAAKFGIDAHVSRDGKNVSGIVITNYERLHYFDCNDFAGVVPDEGSILKSYAGATRKAVTRFMSKMQYRLICTATAAPNDYIELGTLSEALGELSYTEMLKRFFKYLDDKGQKQEKRIQEESEAIIEGNQSYYKKLAFRVSQTIGQWRLRHHAVTDFWRWVASWSRACRMPSDVGFDNGKFVLPPLEEREHVVATNSPPPGMLFSAPAIGMHAERQERKRTLTERCEFVSDLVNHDKPAVVWCHTNDEGNRLEKEIRGAEQIAGCTPDERKIEIYEAFASGELKKLVIKPKIGAWGLNWQHCAHVVTFASHSHEQYYQLVRRCYRFGQQNPVRVDEVATEGEVRVLANRRSKARRADAMYQAIIEQMNSSIRVERDNPYTKQVEIPSWL